jgi:hypothetical protein
MKKSFKQRGEIYFQTKDLMEIARAMGEIYFRNYFGN